jgi:hypothetical protein
MPLAEGDLEPGRGAAAKLGKKGVRRSLGSK